MYINRHPLYMMDFERLCLVFSLLVVLVQISLRTVQLLLDLSALDMNVLCPLNVLYKYRSSSYSRQDSEHCLRTRDNVAK